MEKKDIITFFDKCAPWWDEDMVRNEDLITAILDNGGIQEGIQRLVQLVFVKIGEQISRCYGFLKIKSETAVNRSEATRAGRFLASKVPKPIS